ncbi:hypothetical protein CAPTEDRAFT_198736 [Capitella teleta]|uniref:MARVEL domain-containing protein n=1 Tax=Capitella teleta TaxID=283909 RepID=R7V2Y6_CAPTE|nr:hypothetical protein CAPTEDRAFT_198736 [Capitella teleta]|eukprot:ELU12934.1 hypothetical protein CAPTEDRAFT_198736 [Capitella teleta]
MAGSSLLGACLGVALVAVLVFCVGFASPYWFKIEVPAAGNSGTSSVYGGLFLFCDQQDLNSECIVIFNADEGLTEAWLPAAEAMASIGLLCAIGALICTFVWICSGPSTVVCALASLLYILAGIFGVISVAVFGMMSEFELEHLSWALWLTVVGSVFFVVSGIIAAVASCNVNKVHPLEED